MQPYDIRCNKAAAKGRETIPFSRSDIYGHNNLSVLFLPVEEKKSKWKGRGKQLNIYFIGENIHRE